MKKNIFLPIILALLLNFFYLPTFSQPGIKLNSVNQNNPEKINIHTDRDLYVTGENLFFKLYLFSSSALVNQGTSNFAYLLLRSSNGIIVKSVVKLNNGNTFGSISIPDTLKSGVYQLVAFSNYMRNFGEDEFYYKNILIINRFDRLLTDFYTNTNGNSIQNRLKQDTSFNAPDELLLNIILEKDSFRVREKVVLKINSTVPIVNQNGISVSVSVKEINPLIHPLSNKVPALSQSYIIEDSVTKIKNQSATYMLFFKPESNGMYLSGTIRNNTEPLVDECLYLSTPDSFSNLQYSISDKLGNFDFLINDYYHGKNLILKLKDNNTEKNNSEIILDEKFNLNSRFIQVLPKLSIELKKYIFNCQDIAQIHKSYNLKEVKDENYSLNKTLSYPFVYRIHTSTVVPSKYVALENFKEITSNLLMGVKITKEKKENEVYIANFLTKSYFNYQPALFLDGVPIDNINQIINLSSNDISKIEICNLLKVKGSLNFPGVISVFTYKNLVNSLPFIKPFKKLKTDKILNKSFYNIPEYNTSTNQDLKPDFRQLLYWNPDIILGSNETSEIEFYASDLISEYLVEVTGFTDKGEPLKGYARFKIYR